VLGEKGGKATLASGDLGGEGARARHGLSGWALRVTVVYHLSESSPALCEDCVRLRLALALHRSPARLLHLLHAGPTCRWHGSGPRGLPGETVGRGHALIAHRSHSQCGRVSCMSTCALVVALVFAQTERGCIHTNTRERHAPVRRILSRAAGRPSLSAARSGAVQEGRAQDVYVAR
jgi:hypothetical protein